MFLMRLPAVRGLYAAQKKTLTIQVAGQVLENGHRHPGESLQADKNGDAPPVERERSRSSGGSSPTMSPTKTVSVALEIDDATK